MTWFIAYCFAVAAFINRNDSRKYLVASSFAVIHFINIFETFDGLAYYYTNIASIFTLALITLSVSRRDWALSLSLVFILSTLINVLGIINLEAWQNQGMLSALYYLSYLTTFAELVVLVMMVNGLNGYMADNTRIRNRKYSFRDLATLFNSEIHLGEV